MYKKKISVVLSCFLLFSSFSVSAEGLRYRNFFDKTDAGLNIQAEGLSASDLLHPITWCDKDYKFACMISPVFEFSVPRNGKEVKSWSHMGAKYIVLMTKKEVINGEVFQYRVIRQEWKRLKTDFVYFDEFGVVAIKVLGHELNLVDGRCGFAALSDSQGCLSVLALSQ